MIVETALSLSLSLSLYIYIYIYICMYLRFLLHKKLALIDICLVLAIYYFVKIRHLVHSVVS